MARRAASLVDFPDGNLEPIQALRYLPGQSYVEHHDAIESQRYLPSGPRVLTLLLYLNDLPPGAGGETVFRRVGRGGRDGGRAVVEVAPKTGRAVLWSNVLDRDPDEADLRAYHEAKVVVWGEKHAANFWFHPRDHAEARRDGCA